MLIKLKVAIKVGVPYYFVDPTAPQAAALKSIKLLDFSVKDGRLEWEIMTSCGTRIVGTLRSQQRLPFWPDSWVCPSIPVVLHDKQADGLALDFIFNVPSQYRIDYKGR